MNPTTDRRSRQSGSERPSSSTTGPVGHQPSLSYAVGDHAQIPGNVSVAPRFPVPRRGATSKPVPETGESAQQLGQQLKAAYTKERRQFERMSNELPSNYRPPNELDAETGPGRDYWSDTAKQLQTLGYDPVNYVRVLFDRAIKVGEPVVKPTELLSNRARRVFAAGWENELRDMEILFSHERGRVKRYMSLSEAKSGPDEELFADALTEPDEMSPLFRWCCAYLLGDRKRFRRIMDYYFEDAVRQYLRKPRAYDEVWHAFVPESFRQAAENRITYESPRSAKTTPAARRPGHQTKRGLA